jgi:hypothetical protein
VVPPIVETGRRPKKQQFCLAMEWRDLLPGVIGSSSE